MSFFEEYSRKFYEEAKKDLERAKRALQKNDYPEAVFHSQQCVEKAVKALIRVKKEVAYNRGLILASLFVRVFQDEWSREFNDVVDTIGWFSEYYTRARYPFMLRGKAVSPSEYIDEETARNAVIRAEKVLRIAGRYLSEKGII